MIARADRAALSGSSSGGAPDQDEPHESPVITCMVAKVMVVATVAVANTGMTMVISPKASPTAASSSQARGPP
jgi:hypothetical protein